jgi:hypothetical protein
MTLTEDCPEGRSQDLMCAEAINLINLIVFASETGVNNG